MVSKRQVSTVGLLIPILQLEVEGWADVTRITSELNSYWVIVSSLIGAFVLKKFLQHNPPFPKVSSKRAHSLNTDLFAEHASFGNGNICYSSSGSRMMYRNTRSVISCSS
jgi:hypothetical protein